MSYFIVYHTVEFCHVGYNRFWLLQTYYKIIIGLIFQLELPTSLER